MMMSCSFLLSNGTLTHTHIYVHIFMYFFFYICTPNGFAICRSHKWILSVWRFHWSWTRLHKLILFLAVAVPLMAKLPRPTSHILKISSSIELYLIIWWEDGGESGTVTTRTVCQCLSELIFPGLLCPYWNKPAFCHPHKCPLGYL